jgi:hypothetical protein
MQGDQYSTTLNEALAKTQSELQTLNQTTTELIGFSFDPTITNSSASIEDQLSQAITKAGNVVSQVDEHLANVTDAKVEQVKAVLARVQLLTEVAQDLLDLLRCDYMQAFVDQLKTIFCSDMRGGFILIS